MEANSPQVIHTIAAEGHGVAGKILQEIFKPSQKLDRKPRTFYTESGVWKGWVDCGGTKHHLTLCQANGTCGEGALLLRSVPGKNRSLVAARDSRGFLVLDLGNELSESETDIRRLANQIVADAVMGRIRVKQPPAPRSVRAHPRRKKRVHDPLDRNCGLAGYYC